MSGNKQLDAYYQSRLKSDHFIDEHHQHVGHSQYNSRFVEHEYSYIADLHPPTSTSGPDLSATAGRVEEVEQVDGEFDGSGQGLSGSGQPRLCIGMQQVPAMQLVDHALSPTALSSVVSLADNDTIAVRGVAPLNTVTAAANHNTDHPRVYTRHSSFPLVSGY